MDQVVIMSISVLGTHKILEIAGKVVYNEFFVERG
jgi:hypothetical protein